jgi:hypothetical protein
MRAVVARLLDDERAKILKQAQEAQSDKISLLEKKIQRLASSLESAEKDRDSARRRAQALEAAGYVPFGNVMEAGLGEDDPDRELKLKLLEEIVKFNQEIRGQLSAVGRLPPPRVRSPEATPASEAKEGAAELGPSDASRQPPAASPAEPSAAEEEARLAAELGIERRTIDGAERKPDGEGPVNDAAAPEGAAGGEPEGPEVDPDDLPWEAPAASAGAKKARNVGIRRLG